MNDTTRLNWLEDKAEEFLQGKLLVGEIPAVDLLVNFVTWLETQ
jgi:hypothetical protein